jgi:TonB-dependent receptor
MLYDRIYPVGTGTAGFDYNYQYTEQKINTVNGSLQGKNYLLGLTADWNIAFAQSKINSPFGYRLSFQEPNGGSPVVCKDHPEVNIIPFVNNNFSSALLDSTQWIQQNNFDKEQTYQLNLSRKFTFVGISDELKIGAKHKEKTRWMTNNQSGWNNYKQYPLVNIDGSIIDLSGTRFYGNTTLSAPALTYFFNPPAKSRNLLGLYRINPLISQEALKQWWDLNKNGKPAAAQDMGANGMALLSDYDVTERVTGFYFMNTMNFGQRMTLLFGARVEKELNDYRGFFSDGAVGGTGAVQIVNGQVIEATTSYSETNWLPSTLLSVKPTDYLTIRFALYKALARPDFNLRMPTFAFGSVNSNLGNPNLKDARAWNVELNTQVYHSTIGLFSVSAFYKVVDDLFHQTNSVRIVWPDGGPNRLIGVHGWTTNEKAGFSSRLDTLLDYLNLGAWKRNAIFNNMTSTFTYVLNAAYNSPRPSYAWGFEIEHQMNFGFLPVSWLRNITLSYNISITRSETYIIVSQKTLDTVYIPATPRVPEGWRAQEGAKAKLLKAPFEDQPELYCNASLGYDYKGFSVRISAFYQGRYTRQFSFDGTTDNVVDPFTKWDLALKQEVNSHISLFLSVENIFNNVDKRSQYNKIFDWGYLPLQSESYGTTLDLGVRLSL